jgi:hypothetical protein
MDPHKADLMDSAGLRRKVQKLVEVDINRAYATSVSIKHPWFKCQSLAMVAQFVREPELNRMLDESFNSAMDCHDENRRVSVACWPIEVAIERDRKDKAEKFIKRCAFELAKDVNPISRWCAVSVVHSIKTDVNLLGLFFNDFQKATAQGHGWKVEREIDRLLRDKQVKVDQRYIEYLLQRRAGIEFWKEKNGINKNGAKNFYSDQFD